MKDTLIEIAKGCLTAVVLIVGIATCGVIMYVGHSSSDPWTFGVCLFALYHAITSMLEGVEELS